MKPERDSSGLSHSICAAMFGEGSWHRFLDEARMLLPNGQAYLFYHDANSGAGAFPLSAGADEAMVAAYGEHYSSVNPWMPHAVIRPLGRVVQADDMLRRADLAATEFYNDYLKPQDLHTGFGVTIERDGGVNFLFSVLCADVDPARAQAAKDQLQAAVDPLRRAFAHFRLPAAGEGAFSGFASNGSADARAGVVQIGYGMRVLYVDSDALRLAEDCDLLSIRPFGRFVCSSQPLVEYITRTLAAWDGRLPCPPARTFHFYRGDDVLPLRVTAFRREWEQGASYFRGPECLLVIEDPAAGIDPAIEEFAAMYRLTRAERRLVAALAAGLTPDEIAAQTGVSRNTLKTQLAQIFSKTGLNRQADIVRHVCLMAGGHRATVPARGRLGALS